MPNPLIAALASRFPVNLLLAEPRTGIVAGQASRLKGAEATAGESKAAIAERHRHVRFVPKADICSAAKVQCSKSDCYSITASRSETSGRVKGRLP